MAGACGPRRPPRCRSHLHLCWWIARRPPAAHPDAEWRSVRGEVTYCAGGGVGVGGEEDARAPPDASGAPSPASNARPRPPAALGGGHADGGAAARPSPAAHGQRRRPRRSSRASAATAAAAVNRGQRPSPPTHAVPLPANDAAAVARLSLPRWVRHGLGGGARDPPADALVEAAASTRLLGCKDPHALPTRRGGRPARRAAARRGSPPPAAAGWSGRGISYVGLLSGTGGGVCAPPVCGSRRRRVRRVRRPGPSARLTRSAVDRKGSRGGRPPRCVRWGSHDRTAMRQRCCRAATGPRVARRRRQPALLPSRRCARPAASAGTGVPCGGSRRGSPAAAGKRGAAPHLGSGRSATPPPPPAPPTPPPLRCDREAGVVATSVGALGGGCAKTSPVSCADPSVCQDCLVWKLDLAVQRSPGIARLSLQCVQFQRGCRARCARCVPSSWTRSAELRILGAF